VIERLTFTDYVRVAWRARWWILGTVLVSMTVAGIVGSRQPKLYSATSTILAPRDAQAPSVSSALGMLLGGGGGKDGGSINFPGVQVSVPGISHNLDVFNTLLMSRTMREEVLTAFQKTWGPQVSEMFVSVGTSYNKERTALSVIVGATHPQLAADLANSYFDFLDKRLQQTAETQARRQEVFYKAQLERAAKEVDLAEEQLLKFQQQNRIVATIDPVAKAGAEAGGTLRGSIMALEMQREVLRMRYTDQHPQMRELDKQIAELKKQYSKNLFGQAMDLPAEGPNAKGPRKEFFVSIERMTPTQFALLKLFRNLRIQEAFYTGALQGLENMRYATESAKPQGIEMLDPALVPTTHIKPNVMFIVLAAGALAFIAGVIGSFVREYVVLTLAQQPAVAPAGKRPRNGVVVRPAATGGAALPSAGTTVPAPAGPSAARPESLV